MNAAIDIRLREAAIRRVRNVFEANAVMTQEQSGMRIEQATLEMLPIVTAIVQTTIDQVYPHYYPAGAVSFFKRLHAEGNIREDMECGAVFFLLSSDTPVATATVQVDHIQRLFVLKEHQCRGYGGVLMDFAEKQAATYQKTVVDASLPAKRFYLDRGYQDKEYHVIKTDNGDCLCYDVMEKCLPKYLERDDTE